MTTNIPIDLMIHRCTVYGFTYPLDKGAKDRVPVLKKDKIRCMVQDADEKTITWYWQRQALVNNTMFLIDKPDFDLIAINDRIVHEGVNFRVAGRHDLAGLHRVFQVDMTIEVE